MLLLQCRLNTKLFPDCIKLTGYFSSAVNVASFHPCVGSLPRIKISFPLLLICTDELISAPKIMTFSPMLPYVNENSERESNPMPYPLCSYLSKSVFLFSYANPNKQLLNVKIVFKFLNHGVST